MIESVVAAIKERPRGAKLLVTRDLKTNLDKPEVDWREEEIAAALMTADLKDILDQFLLQRRS